MTILRTIRAAHAVAREHEISPTVLVARAVEQGAMRPSDAVLREPAYFRAWEDAAKHLVFAPIGIGPADHLELVIECDRRSGRVTPERVGEAIKSVASFIILIVAPAVAVCVL